MVVQTDAILNIEKKLNGAEKPKENIFAKKSAQQSEPAVKEGQSEQYYRDLFTYGKISLAELQSHLAKINKNNQSNASASSVLSEEDKEKQKIYDEALTKMQKGSGYATARFYMEAIELFSQIKDYRSSEELIEICKTRMEELKNQK